MRMRSGWTRIAVACGVILAPFAMAGVAQADQIKAGEIVVPEEAPPPPPPPPMVHVEEEEDWNRLGFYLGIGPSWFAEQFENDDGRLINAVTEQADNSWGFNFRFGYRFWDYMAVEGLYEYANDFGKDFNFVAGNDQFFGNWSVQTNVFTANLKLIAPFGRFQPYLGGGVGFMQANLDVNSNGPVQSRNLNANSDFVFASRVMGGFDVYITPQVSLYAESTWVIPSSQLEDLEYVSVNAGARYIF
jgi:opacity protein-like surface antigen